MARERYSNPDSPGGDGKEPGFDPEATSPYVSLAAAEVAEDAADPDVTDEAGGIIFHCDTDGSTDTAFATIGGWTTDATHPITIQVDSANRSAGVWDASKYHIIVDAEDGIYLQEDHIRLVGVQVANTNAGASDDVVYIFSVLAGGTIHVNHCIIKGCVANAATDGICYQDGDGDFSCYNNIIYNFDNSAAGYGINSSAANTYAYNNTIYDIRQPLRQAAGTFIAKNNICNNVGLQTFVGTMDAKSARNITDYAPTAFEWAGTAVDSGTCDDTGANKILDGDQNFLTTCKVGYIVKNTTDTTFTYITAVDGNGELTVNDDIFVDTETYEISENFFKDVDFATAGSDFHLAATETIAIENGEDLDPDDDELLNVTDDIEGDTRDTDTPDIGADEYVGEEPPETIVPQIQYLRNMGVIA